MSRATAAAAAAAVEVAVVGGGVVGTAIAAQLAARGREVVLLERNSQLGAETSSRSSEVVHAGLYYPTGSRKADACVRGRHLLYQFCERAGVPARCCGKLIVANGPHQVQALERLRRQGEANGVADLALLSTRQVQKMEPLVRCDAAIFSPSTGIVDSHALLLALQGKAEAHGATFVTKSEVYGGELSLTPNEPHVLHVRPSHLDTGQNVTKEDDRAFKLKASYIVNAAGLWAQQVCKTLAGWPLEMIDPLHVAKGNYFALHGGKSPFKHLVYPMPEPGGLGIHLTIDLSGQARFGPDVEWLDVTRPFTYDVDAERAQSFYRSIRQYLPSLADGSLVPAYSGIRPKLSGPGEPPADFHIRGPEEHFIPRAISLFGIESPGITASLALAEEVSDRLDEME